MSRKFLRVKFLKDGTYTINAEGFENNLCLAKAKKLTDLLGKVEHVELKPEAEVQYSEFVAENPETEQA